MTINPEEYQINPLEEPPLTPTNDGKVQFLGPDTVRYISPQRIEVPRQSIRQLAQAPSPPNYQTVVQSPPQMFTMPQMMPIPTPMAYPQMYQPQMTYIPHPMMTMTSPVVMQSPPVPVQQQTSPSGITLNINNSPQSVAGGVGGGAGGGALICPKCRKGIITRQQDKFRKKLLICLSMFCCPLTCGLPLLCICCNYVDACACCGKGYGHRGRKNQKKNVNAVKI
uniref:Brain protein I3 n=1 Tax=Caenorhabditis japonica TaxID=281687 RepID=A0A8R1E178_CAEJA